MRALSYPLILALSLGGCAQSGGNPENMQPLASNSAVATDDAFHESVDKAAQDTTIRWTTIPNHYNDPTQGRIRAELESRAKTLRVADSHFGPPANFAGVIGVGLGLSHQNPAYTQPINIIAYHTLWKGTAQINVAPTTSNDTSDHIMDAPTFFPGNYACLEEQSVSYNALGNYTGGKTNTLVATDSFCSSGTRYMSPAWVGTSAQQSSDTLKFWSTYVRVDSQSIPSYAINHLQVGNAWYVRLYNNTTNVFDTVDSDTGSSTRGDGWNQFEPKIAVTATIPCPSFDQPLRSFSMHYLINNQTVYVNSTNSAWTPTTGSCLNADSTPASYYITEITQNDSYDARYSGY